MAPCKHLVGVQLDLLDGPEVPMLVSIPKDARARMRHRALASGDVSGLPADDYQTRVLVALRAGPAGATQVAEAAGLERDTVNRVLQTLMQKGQARVTGNRLPTDALGWELEWEAKA